MWYYVGEKVGQCFMPWTGIENMTDRARDCCCFLLSVRVFLVLGPGGKDSQNHCVGVPRRGNVKEPDFLVFNGFQ